MIDVAHLESFGNIFLGEGNIDNVTQGKLLILNYYLLNCLSNSQLCFNSESVDSITFKMIHSFKAFEKPKAVVTCRPKWCK